MATETEKQIQAIKIDLTGLEMGLESARDAITPLRELVSEVQQLKTIVNAQAVELEPVRELTKKVAVLEHQITELTKTRELWGQRGWMVLTICLSAGFSLASAILGTLLTVYLKAKS